MIKIRKTLERKLDWELRKLLQKQVREILKKIWLVALAIWKRVFIEKEFSIHHVYYLKKWGHRKSLRQNLKKNKLKICQNHSKIWVTTTELLQQQIRHQQEETRQVVQQHQLQVYIQQQQVNAFLSVLSKFKEKWEKTFNIFLCLLGDFLQILSHHWNQINLQVKRTIRNV